MVERGDNFAAAVIGDCRPMAALLHEVMDIPGAVLQAEEDFLGEAKVFDMGGLFVCCVEADPHVVVQRPGVPDGRPSDGGKLHIILVLSGAMRITRGDTVFTLREGDWAVASNEALSRVELSAAKFIVLVIPEEEAGHLARSIGKVGVRRLDGRSGAGRLFYEFVRLSAEEISAINLASRVSFSDAILNVLRATVLELAFAERGPAADRLLYDRICSIIEKNLADPALTVDFIAGKLRCTKRYLHLIFAKHNAGHTLKSFINHQRMVRCREEILLSRHTGASIAEIAHRWGFHDPSYFGRLFRRTFGLTPSEFRFQPSSTAEPV